MPRPMADMGEFWDRFYPLRVRNSLTRSKVRVPPRCLPPPAGGGSG